MCFACRGKTPFKSCKWRKNFSVSNLADFFWIGTKFNPLPRNDFSAPVKGRSCGMATTVLRGSCGDNGTGPARSWNFRVLVSVKQWKTLEFNSWILERREWTNSRISHSRTAWDELLRTRKWGFCGGKPQKSKIRSVYTFSTMPKHHCCAYNFTNSVEKQEQPEKYPEMANITFQPLLLKTLTSGMLLVCESEKDAGDGL